ncbi:hypothetical protein [Gottfriedia acidiceleris]|uniref:Uncharacterized protein n=1 Tax=Gottfriedia acidiceleris TaxID=371036 RepID=A0ABY4JQZ0_9BACI|nr:hypothetical protein [Gottfriedia acidiceleris]UPM56219.1 hypothetical protein MY490_10455 [Gottfriedia acidiceleris]
MEQTKWREIALIISPVILLPIIMFLFLHLSPSVAIRTQVFMDGHPIIAIKTDITEDSGYYDLTKLPKESAPMYFGHFKVSKHGFLYFAHSAGFA